MLIRKAYKFKLKTNQEIEDRLAQGKDKNVRSVQTPNLKTGLANQNFSVENATMKIMQGLSL